MANTFKSVGLQTTNNYATIYTAPAGTTTIVLAIQCANIHASTAYKIYVRVHDETTSTEFILLNGALVSAGAAIDAVSGKLVLNEGDIVSVKSDTTATFELYMSYMEMT